jgi:hypothetical protein
MIAYSSEAKLANTLIMASSSPSKEDFPALLCGNGLLSITLEGTQDNWKNIFTKVE